MDEGKNEKGGGRYMKGWRIREANGDRWREAEIREVKKGRWMKEGK